jgi:glycosyltransferase involved in cell wall biosynthesis
MNILIIDNSVAFTGAFKCAYVQAQLFPEHRFIFVLPEKSTVVPELKEKGFAVYTLPMVEIRKSVPALLRYPFSLIRNTSRLKKILRQEKIDIIQANDFYNLLGAASRLSGFKGKLITYVRLIPATIPRPLRALWFGVAKTYSDTIMTVSDAVRNALPPSNKMVRVYDPVKLNEKLPAKKELNNLRIQILYLANYIRGKGQDHAIQAFAKAYQSNSNLRLKFAGGDMGLEKNRKFREQLVNEIGILGLSDVVSFHDFVTDVESEIKNADIVLNFSQSEALSMTCLESVFYGTALIATRCGGPEEIIVHDKTGILVPIGDTDAMSNAILRLAGDPELRRNMTLAGKDHIKQQFDINQFIKRFETIFG